MIEGFAFGSCDRRRFFGCPRRFRTALQQKYVLTRSATSRNGPLDILRAAVMTFNLLGDVDESTNLVVR